MVGRDCEPRHGVRCQRAFARLGAVVRVSPGASCVGPRLGQGTVTTGQITLFAILCALFALLAWGRENLRSGQARWNWI